MDWYGKTGQSIGNKNIVEEIIDMLIDQSEYEVVGDSNIDDCYHSQIKAYISLSAKDILAFMKYFNENNIIVETYDNFESAIKRALMENDIYVKIARVKAANIVNLVGDVDVYDNPPYISILIYVDERKR